MSIDSEMRSADDANVPELGNRPGHRKVLRWFVVLGALIITAFLYIIWPPFYYQEPIRAQLVDARTGEPVRGAAVAAIWVAAHGGWEETYSLYRHDETTTDQYGVFELQKWGPRWRRSRDGYLRDQDPILYIYHPGYEGLKLDNSAAYIPTMTVVDHEGQRVRIPKSMPSAGQVIEPSQRWRSRSAKRFSYWSKKTIEMQRAVTAADRGRALLIGQAHTLDDRSLFPKFWSVWVAGRQRISLDELPEDIRPEIAMMGDRP